MPNNETPEQRRERLDKRNAARRQKLLDETPEQKRARLDKDNERENNKTTEERQEQLDKRNAARRQKLMDETPEQKRARLDKDNERKNNKTTEERQEQLDKRNAARHQKLMDETPEQKRARLAKDNERKNNKTTEERQEQLDKRNAARQQKLMDETPEQKRARLDKDKDRWNNKTEEERRHRLDKNNEQLLNRRLFETEEERRVRLDNRCRYANMQRSEETDDERRARLCQNNLRLSKQSEAERQMRYQRKNVKRRTGNTLSLNLKEIARNAYDDETSVDIHSCGKLEHGCKECSAVHFANEVPTKQTKEDKLAKMGMYSECCMNGKIKLESLPPYPKVLKDLLDGTDSLSKEFLENIRYINSSFAFASMGANIQKPPGFGPWCFRIHGQIYHRTGTLHPPPGEDPKYAQLYILDTEQANEVRQRAIPGVNIKEPLMNKVSQTIKEINPFAKAYKMLYEVELESIREANEKGMEPKEIAMAIIQDRKKDKRRYNIPTSNEVAIVFRNEDGVPPHERDILVHLKFDPNDPEKRPLQRISILDKNLDPLVYPMLFPYGSQGWGIDIQRNCEGSRLRVTQKEFYAYLFSVRTDFNAVLSAGKLTQQYAVDSYVRMEANRLRYIEMEQPKIRGDSLKGLEDWLATEASNQGKTPGRAIILPSSFQGSPRNMQQKYQDAMAIVTKFGKPDLFVTVTCNPKWPEITENLGANQKVEHRPDLVARVFNMKLKSILKDITDKDGGIFGKVTAFVYVIEFQKRGLPHAHILLILEKDSKLKEASEIDHVVRAEIPNMEQNPRLYEIVTNHMIHGPCGKQNEKCPCMVDGKCSKDFPKEISENTNTNIDGFAQYRRREIEPLIVRGKAIDNRWVVPYNPYLLLKYNCHINTEVCLSVKSVKYLFKYVYKGYDCASLKLKDSNVLDHNEINQYVDARYVCAPEALWRIFGYVMHNRSHSVERLAVHMPGEQFVAVHAPDDANEVVEKVQERVEKSKNKHTTLTGWFELNKVDTEARELNYFEIPHQYTWHRDTTKWERRQKCFNVIGRLYTVNPKEGERYYLRLLLLNVKGATSFEDLKTVDGVVYDTFKESALARGFLLDDNVWKATLNDAAICQMPRQMRELFAYLCVFCSPSEPSKLWSDFAEFLIEDICFDIHKKIGDCQNCEFYALKELDNILRLHGTSLAELGLKVPPSSLPPRKRLSINIEYELIKGDDMIETLNAEQSRAFTVITNAMNDSDSKNAKCFMLDGPGGSGKTYLYETLLHYCRGRELIALPSASTGIAANLLDGGRTYHSLFKLPLNLTETSVSNMKLNSFDANAMKKASLIIIDECTMMSALGINCIERLMKEIMTEVGGETTPMGGKVFLLGGDFRQCLAIVPHAMRAAIVQSSLKYSKAWKHFEHLTLHNNMRSLDPMYSEWLLRMGNGTLGNEFDLGEDIIEIPENFICRGSTVTEIYGTTLLTCEMKDISKRAILCPKNEDVDKINDEVSALIEGECITYFSSDRIDDEDKNAIEFYSIEFLNSVTPSGMPPHKLKLKVGTIIMLLRNLNTRRGLCNGTRLIVTDLAKNVIKAEVITGSGTGEHVLIPRIDICPSEGTLPFKMHRRQFPVKAAFAMTINKSQGQTLDKVGIYLPGPVFGHGQLYVAFSRVRRAEDVKIKVVNTEEQGELIENCSKVFTKNVVYQEIF